MANSFQIAPVTHLKGDIGLPGDKSISHRALILASIAEGWSCIENLLMGADNLATLAALKQLSVVVDQGNGKIEIEGYGLRNLKESAQPLNFQNSGTGLRLMTGLLAGQSFPSILTGDESLRQRPMGRIVEPLRKWVQK